MNLELVKEQKSFLSNEVEELVRSASVQSRFGTEVWVTPDCRIQWDKVEKVLSGILEEEENRSWFREAVRLLSPLLSQCHNCLVNLRATGHHHDTLSSLLQWTHQAEGLLTCSELVCEGCCETDNLAALLSVTAITERTLGDLLWVRQRNVPFLLRDLLLTPDLTLMLGSTRVLTLRVLIGSVLGLNLRNLAWHGFLTPPQAHPAFPASLIIILADCASLFQDSGKFGVSPCSAAVHTSSEVPKDSKILTRPLVAFQESVCVGNLFEDVRVARGCAEEVVTASPLVPSVMVPVWSRVLDLLESGRCGLALTLLLPALESSLRCLFALTNRSPRRLLTAQTSTLYTTLDQILHPQVTQQDICSSDFAEDNRLSYFAGYSASVDCVKDKMKDLCVWDQTKNLPQCSITNGDPETGSKVLSQVEIKPHEVQDESEPREANRMLPVIGRKLNEALHDLLNFIQGPRVRDRVSHGEASLHDIPPEVVHHTHCLSFLIISLGVSRQSKRCNSIDETCYKCGPDNSRKFSQRNCNSRNGCTCIKSNSGSNSRLDHTETCCESTDNKWDELIRSYKCEAATSISSGDVSDETQNFIAELKRCIDNYKVNFHPSALFHRQLIDCISLFDSWLSWKRVDITALDYDAWSKDERYNMPDVLVFHPLEASLKTTDFYDIPKVLNKIWNIDYKVLYRPRLELEAISVLHKISSSILTALENMQENLKIKYLQFTEKKLRSRQRETYRRQLNSVPRIVASCFLSAQVVYLIFSSVHRMSHLTPECYGVLLKVLKVLLKVQENVVSFSSLSSNRWEEALRISSENIDVIRKNFSS